MIWSSDLACPPEKLSSKQDTIVTGLIGAIKASEWDGGNGFDRCSIGGSVAANDFHREPNLKKL
jgi:hypothetical protein